ncbi:uncharacterized protein LOC122368496 [Amphibalanus amphitrite]|uniref:uncharacterized protein LOC122368496 n=1 Tax=Amphibalanus amphitrite TaxID=1232801 RepID=UPI001C923200|nr:uncharacterized protein LOC122368496 [Amphibalanus amphitrite]
MGKTEEIVLKHPCLADRQCRVSSGREGGARNEHYPVSTSSAATAAVSQLHVSVQPTAGHAVWGSTGAPVDAAPGCLHLHGNRRPQQVPAPFRRAADRTWGRPGPPVGHHHRVQSTPGPLVRHFAGLAAFHAGCVAGSAGRTAFCACVAAHRPPCSASAGAFFSPVVLAALKRRWPPLPASALGQWASGCGGETARGGARPTPSGLAGPYPGLYRRCSAPEPTAELGRGGGGVCPNRPPDQHLATGVFRKGALQLSAADGRRRWCATSVEEPTGRPEQRRTATWRPSARDECEFTLSVQQCSVKVVRVFVMTANRSGA